jgi:hypothetical protein
MNYKLNIFLIFFSIYFYKSINCQDCGVNPTTDITDCFNRNDTNNTDMQCCYLTSDNNSLCKLISIKNYTSTFETITINNTAYNIFCNTALNNTDTLSNIGLKCGPKDTPETYKDCTNTTDPTDNQCCYYSNNSTHNRFCFWLGRFSNQIIKINTDDNLIIVCDTPYFIFSCKTPFLFMFFTYILIILF